MGLATIARICGPAFSRGAANALIPIRRVITAMGGAWRHLALILNIKGARSTQSAGGLGRLERLERRKADICPELAATVFSHAREGIVIIDPVGRVISANDAFTRITGYSQNEVQGRSVKSHNLIHQTPAFYRPINNALFCRGHWSGETRGCHKDGTELSLRLSVSVVLANNGRASHYVAILSDITKLKRRQQLLERNAHYDALTQLPNRLLFSERMNLAVSRARIHHHRLAVAFIDLDGFKAVNDCYGHDMGDRVLKILAQRIQETVRENDILARLGGDEFVAGLAGLQQPQDCEPVLKRMLQAASAPIEVGDQTVQVSASIGVAFFPEHGQEIDTLIGKADQAMYLSKRSGGSGLAFCVS